ASSHLAHACLVSGGTEDLRCFPFFAGKREVNGFKMAKAAIDEPHITAHRDGPLSTSDKSIKIMQRRAISGPGPVEFAHIETSKVCAMRLDICFAHQAVHEGRRVLFHLQYEDLRQ